MGDVQQGRPLRPQPGSSIAPEDAVGRHSTTRRAVRDFHGGNNLLLTDPRRMGKTVWIDKFCAAPGNGFVAAKIDYEGVRTSAEFVGRTVQSLAPHQSLPRRTREKLEATFTLDVSIGYGPVALKPGIAERPAAALLADALTSLGDHVPDDTLFVVAMDEVPMALLNIVKHEDAEAAAAMLQTLRNLRRHRESRLRWVLSGSVGFHHVLRHCGCTEAEINDLTNLPLGPLPEPEAAELAERLLMGIKRAPEQGVIAALTDQTDGIPFLIHSLAHRLEDAGTGPVSVGDVGAAFTEYVADRDESRAVTHLLTRLDPLYGKHVALAEGILDRVACESKVAAEDYVADRDTVVNLIDDHYLHEREGALLWRYEALRRIWAQRRGLQR